jgi:hypothetical protein
MGLPAGALLTLVAFRNYRAGFASRCALIVITAAAGGEGAGIGVDRFVLVVAGGAVGLALVWLVMEGPAALRVAVAAARPRRRDPRCRTPGPRR